MGLHVVNMAVRQYLWGGLYLYAFQTGVDGDVIFLDYARLALGQLHQDDKGSALTLLVPQRCIVYLGTFIPLQDGKTGCLTKTRGLPS